MLRSSPDKSCTAEQIAHLHHLHLMGEVENACFDRSLTKAVQQNKSRICITSTRQGEVENACFDRFLTKAVQQNESRICITST